VHAGKERMAAFARLRRPSLFEIVNCLPDHMQTLNTAGHLGDHVEYKIRVTSVSQTLNSLSNEL